MLNVATANTMATTRDLDGLLAAFGQGDARAAREITALLTPRLYAMAARVLGDGTEAEDVVQETMLRLWRAAPGWESGQAKVSTWAWRVASNLAIDQLRKRRGNVELDEENAPADQTASAEAILQDQARRSALQEALAELPERQAQSVVLRHLEELSNPEIAEIMDLGVEAVESLTARGKRNLAAILGKRKKELGYDG